jgi:hypothetical protein
MPDPILTAETILTTAIRNALAPYAGTHQGRPKVYYQLNTDGAPRPLLIFQFQSDISRLDWVGDIGATALITVKAQADDLDTASALLALAAPGMANLAYGGYTIRTRYVRSPIIPPISGVYQSAHIFRITLERN